MTGDVNGLTLGTMKLTSRRVSAVALSILTAAISYLLVLGDGTDLDTSITPRTVASTCDLSMTFVVGGTWDPTGAGTPRVPAGPRMNIVYPASIAPFGGRTSGDESIRQAKASLDTTARAFRTRCPRSAVNVVAYSLGAAAASDLVAVWNADPVMSGNTWFTLIGNPKKPLDRATGRGGIMGQLPSILPGLTHTGFRPAATNVTEVCATRDVYCSATRDIRLVGAALGTYVFMQHTMY